MNKQDAAHSFTEAPTWYTEEQMYHWLIRENYSEQIAKELSCKWAADLQGAFSKGYEKGTKELTRLRSELQQKDEEIAELVEIIRGSSKQISAHGDYNEHLPHDFDKRYPKSKAK